MGTGRFEWRLAARLAQPPNPIPDGAAWALYLVCQFQDTSFRFERIQSSIDREAALDGMYVIRTNVAASQASAEDAVKYYKELSPVERTFRRATQ